MIYRIREYQPGQDALGLRDCIVELQEFERTIEPALPAGTAMADAYLAYILERCGEYCGQMFVAEVDGKVVGFVSVWARVPPTEPDEPQTEYAYVSDLVVLAPFRQRGLGRALLEQAERYAREQQATVIRIGVLAQNVSAKRLYLEVGFTERRIELSKDLGESQSAGMTGQQKGGVSYGD
jgi:ribosomal protein S18 acetylase RimI-like enzyme